MTPGSPEATLLVHLITADICSSDDALLLRVTSLLHRRAVPVRHLVWRPPTTPAADQASTGRLEVLVACDIPRATLVMAGLVGMIGLRRVGLDRDIAWGPPGHQDPGP